MFSVHPAFTRQDFLRSGRHCPAATHEVQQFGSIVKVKEVDLIDARSTCHELRRQHEEDLAMCVARKAKLEAEELVRHESQMHEVVMRYERRLAKAEGWTDVTAEVSTRRATEEAQAVAVAAGMKATRYKQRAAKQKEKQERVARKMVDSKALFRAQCAATTRSRNALLARAAFALWRTVAVDAQRITRWEACAQGQTDTLQLAQQKFALSCVFVRWVSLTCIVRHENQLRGQLEEVGARSTSAIASLRAEGRWLRVKARKQALLVLEACARVLTGIVMRAWCTVVAASRHEVEMQTRIELAKAQAVATEVLLQEELIRLKRERRRYAIAAAEAQAALIVASALQAWSAAARASASETVLRRELGEAEARATWALCCARDETRALRRQRLKHGIAAVTAIAKVSLSSAWVAWLKEAQNLKAARKLSLALEDAEFRHQRALSLHRSQARSAKEVARHAGRSAVEVRQVAVVRSAFRLWHCAEHISKLQRLGAEHGRVGAEKARELEEQIGKARRAGSRAGQLAARRAWAAWGYREGDIALVGLVVRLWFLGVDASRDRAEIERKTLQHSEWFRAAEARHAAELEDARRAAAVATAGTSSFDRDALLEAEKLRTRAAVEVAQQSLLLAWPTAARQIGRLNHWRAAAFEAWWWAVVLPRCEIEDVGIGAEQNDVEVAGPGAAFAVGTPTDARVVAGIAAVPRPPPVQDQRRRRSSRGPTGSGR